MNDRMDGDAWLDALRGRPRSGTDAITLREADDLRRALLDVNRERSSDAADQEELQRLLFRLRRDNVLSSRTSANRWRAPFAAAATIALCAGIAVMMPSGWWAGGDDPVLRGGGSVQIVEVADVPAALIQIERVLRAAGAIVLVSELEDGAREVATTVPKENIEAVALQLAPLGVAPPTRDGSLRIEVRKKR